MWSVDADREGRESYIKRKKEFQDEMYKLYEKGLEWRSYVEEELKKERKKPFIVSRAEILDFVMRHGWLPEKEDVLDAEKRLKKYRMRCRIKGSIVLMACLAVIYFFTGKDKI